MEELEQQTPALNPDDFDLDGWIDGATRATETVRLYNKGHLNDKLRELEHRISVARQIPQNERGITDDNPDALEDEWAQVAQELTESALPVKVQALTSDEIGDAKDEAKKAKAKDSDVGLYIAAAGCVSPKFTVEQLKRLRKNAGDAGVGELAFTVMRLSNEAPRPTAPFSQRSSGGSRG